jgi:hypothetical protein
LPALGRSTGMDIQFRHDPKKNQYSHERRF